MKSVVCAWLALGLSLCMARAADPAPSTWEAVILAHAHRYPKLQPQDLYKLLVQATLGAEHAAPSESAAGAWLEREVKDLGSGPEEPLLEPITPDGALVRVHLRPYLARGGNLAELAQAFAATGRRKFDRKDDLAARWRVVVELAAAGRLPFDVAAARAWGEKMAAAQWPAVHHSPEFAAEYRPAYRVVAADLLKK